VGSVALHYFLIQTRLTLSLNLIGAGKMDGIVQAKLFYDENQPPFYTADIAAAVGRLTLLLQERRTWTQHPCWRQPCTTTVRACTKPEECCPSQAMCWAQPNK
jgi:hypothetical protein